MKNKFISFWVFTLLFTTTVFGQYRDLINNKELDKLNQLNPAFTGVLNQLRLLSNKGEDVTLGFESRLFGSKNYLGAQYFSENLDLVQRSGLRMSYARDLILKQDFQFKVAGGLSIDSKQLTETSGFGSGVLVEDFDGTFYNVDSINSSSFAKKVNSADLSFGTAVIYKNILFGASAKHLNNPNVSLQSGFVRISPIEFSGELAGFLKVNPQITLIPSAIYAVQDGNSFSSLGMGIRYKAIVLQGQYENQGVNEMIDMSVTGRYKRYLVHLGVVQPLANNTQSSEMQLRLTINASLSKFKNELEGIRNHIKSVY